MGLSREQAEARLREFEASRNPDNKPTLNQLEVTRLENEWVGMPNQPQSGGVRLEGVGQPVIFHGALGKLVPVLGLPKTNELRLGSAWMGRYQDFERGIGVWEVPRDRKGNEVRGVPDFNFAYPAFMGDSPIGGENVSALAAFFDFRGFTDWSSRGVAGNRIQSVVRSLEISFQEAFNPEKSAHVFVKGTGDGLMIVSEAAFHSSAAVTVAHATDFYSRCRETVRAEVRWLREQGLSDALAVGCGITTGEVTRVYILGRFDYLGAAVNRASKIQGKARNEICVDSCVMALLREAEPDLCAIPLSVEGWKLGAD